MHTTRSRVHQSQPLQGRRHLTDQEESVKERERAIETVSICAWELLFLGHWHILKMDGNVITSEKDRKRDRRREQY